MKILYATDGSEYAEKAAEFLARLDFSARDEIIVLYVVSLNPFMDDGQAYYRKIGQIKEELAPKILDAASGLMKNLGAKISRLVVEGYPDRSIIRTAGDLNADLVVMGAKGARGVKALMIGSVTRSVVINSPRSVLVVRPGQWEKGGNLRIICAVDGSEQACATARLLNMIPFPPATEMTLLHVIWPELSDIPERFAPEINDTIKQEVARARSQEFAESGRIIQSIRDILSKKYSRVEGITRVGDPLSEILSAAGQLQADMTAAGYTGRRGLAAMMGSVSRNILNHAAGSVLIGKVA